MALNVFSISNIAIWVKGFIRGYRGDGEKILRGFLDISSEVSETHGTGFFNYVPFYFYTCLPFLDLILSYLLLLNCDYFHYVNSQMKLRKVERI